MNTETVVNIMKKVVKIYGNEDTVERRNNG